MYVFINMFINNLRQNMSLDILHGDLNVFTYSMTKTEDP